MAREDADEEYVFARNATAAPAMRPRVINERDAIDGLKDLGDDCLSFLRGVGAASASLVDEGFRLRRVGSAMGEKMVERVELQR